MSHEFASYEPELLAGERRLPVHGFVLAGGKSSRMGRDKALLPFRGRPMVEIAVEKLRSFCAAVSIAGNRDDLNGFAAVVPETRVDCGPGAGIEAGLRACTQPWALFVPVDVPLVPAELLRRWAVAVLDRSEAGCGASFLLANGEPQPAFSMLRRDCEVLVQSALNHGERRVRNLLYQIDQKAVAGWLWPKDTLTFAPGASELRMEYWFSNVNTQNELELAELWSEEWEAGPLRG